MKNTSEELPVMTDAQLKSQFHNISQKYTSGIYRDEKYWKPVKDMLTELRGILENLNIVSSAYAPGFPPDYKTWQYVGAFKDPKGRQRVVWAQVRAHGAGTTEDPLGSYDLTLNFEVMSPQNIQDTKQKDYLKALGVNMKEASYIKLAAQLDIVAERLESKGFIREAEEIDIISNTLEKYAEEKEEDTVGINEFVKRQTKGDFAGTQISDTDLEKVRKKTEQMAQSGQLKPGYAPYVKIAVINDPSMKSPIVRITPENEKYLVTEKTKRRDFEDEYEHRYFPESRVSRVPSHHVNVILYSKDHLDEETNGNPTGSDWDIISINAEPYSEDSPIPPETLKRNMAGMDKGGSGWQHKQEELSNSEKFWKEHAMVK